MIHTLQNFAKTVGEVRPAISLFSVFLHLCVVPVMDGKKEAVSASSCCRRHCTRTAVNMVFISGPKPGIEVDLIIIIPTVQ